ncbi:hypothetical protein [Thermaurantiacus sp.]
MAERDPAEVRLWQLTLARLAGVGIAVLGLWVVGTTPLDSASPFAGLALMLAGAGLVTFAPRLFR